MLKMMRCWSRDVSVMLTVTYYLQFITHMKNWLHCLLNTNTLLLFNWLVLESGFLVKCVRRWKREALSRFCCLCRSENWSLSSLCDDFTAALLMLMNTNRAELMNNKHSAEGWTSITGCQSECDVVISPSGTPAGCADSRSLHLQTQRWVKETLSLLTDITLLFTDKHFIFVMCLKETTERHSGLDLLLMIYYLISSERTRM